MISAGDLRYRVTIKEQTTTKDTEGVVSPGYADATKLWANMKPVGGEIAQKRYGITEEGITMQMICRPNSYVKEVNLVVWKKQYYEIRYVAPYLERYEALLRPVVI